MWVCWCRWNRKKREKRKEKKKNEWKLINEPVISFCLLETLVFSFACFNGLSGENEKKIRMKIWLEFYTIFSSLALTNYY